MTIQVKSDRGDQGNEPEAHQPVGGGAAVQLGDRARQSDEQEEGENSCLDRERAERDLLGAEHAGEHGHPAVERGEDEQGAGDAGFVRNDGGFGGEFGGHGGEG